MKNNKENNINNIINNHFLNIKVSIYLINGIKINGFITNFCLYKHIILKNNLDPQENQQIIFWNAIATIIINDNNIFIRSYNFSEEKSPINHLQNKNIKIFLCNGIKLVGILKEFYFNSYIILEKDEQQQLIFWTAISTISSEEPNIFYDSNSSSLMDYYLNKKALIFFKNGIKISGTITSYIFENTSSNDLSYIIIDKIQIIFAKHLSTITLQ